MHRLLHVVVLFAAGATVFLAGGCATAPLPTPVETRPIPPPEPVPTADLSSVAGRLIVLDPGHGGRWPGAVAPGTGLRESDVNLRVALALRDMLHTAGAQVVLTRETDTALADTLSQDLAARTQLANDRGAEIFVSIHHNADIDVSGKNDLEVYYRITDEWASLDLAQTLTYELARRLRADAAAKRLLPGNYKVLRDAAMPAVLLESSYMTNAENAAVLATDGGVQREAAAIAAGLARYFALNPPRVTRAYVADTGDVAVSTVFFEVAPPQGLEPATISLTCDGTPLKGLVRPSEGGFFCTLSEPLPNGASALTLRGRNHAGAAFQHVVHAEIDRPARRVLLRQRPETIPAGWPGELCLEVRVLDVFGYPVKDGTPVGLQSRTTDQRAHTAGGIARFYFFPKDHTGPFAVTAGGLQTTFEYATGGTSVPTLRVVDAAGAPVAGAVVEESGQVLGITTPEGWTDLPGASFNLQIRRHGFDEKTAPLQGGQQTVALRPAAGGVLHRKRIVLDPWFGGYQPGAVDNFGGRASDASLDVARRLAALLTEAGAEVELTRASDVNPSDLERLWRAETAKADVVLAITFGSPGGASRLLNNAGTRVADAAAFVGHYPGSANGERLARALAGELGIEQLAPSVAFIVQQTSAPAVIVQPADLGRAGAASPMQEAGVRRRMAEAMYAAFVQYFGQP